MHNTLIMSYVGRPERNAKIEIHNAAVECRGLIDRSCFVLCADRFHYVYDFLCWPMDLLFTSQFLRKQNFSIKDNAVV